MIREQEATLTDFPSAVEIAQNVRTGALSARDALEAVLVRIAAVDPDLNCFTGVFMAQAIADAERVDAMIAAGADPGPLAGVPFAVKDLFDIRGVVTTAGARLREACATAVADAEVVACLKAAGAVLVGKLNMDEFAYGFSTENAHYGVTRNPHALNRLAGGSSGGSAAAVAAGLAPITLGSDTNGSVRVPASLCGVYGLRPTHGLISEMGVFPFVERLDTVGVFTRTLADLRLTLDVLSDAEDLLASDRVRAGRLTGWFFDNADDEMRAGVARVAEYLGAEDAALDLAEPARSAAFVLTAAEGGRRHLDNLRDDASAFDPATRRRLVAGVLTPDDVVRSAEIVAERFVSQFDALMGHYDILIAPATPTTAPLFSEGTISLNGKIVSARANLGVCTQPLSLTGAPAISVPLSRAGRLPLGVQLVSRRGEEHLLFKVAEKLVEAEIVSCDPPDLVGARV